MPQWNNDNELFALMKSVLYSAVIGDILDQMHRYHQFLPPKIRPLENGMKIAGRAMPVLEADVFGDRPGNNNPLLAKSFGLMLEALDDLKPNEVYLCSGASPSYALIGELMCTRMQVLGAAGAVANGYHRDNNGILDLDFPCFSYGAYAQDQAPRGKVIDYRVPISIEGVHVNPGDIVYGDYDGVLIIPQSIEAEVIERAYEKATGEKNVFQAIRGGMKAKDAFERFGIM
jgi:regulator of RNase E activity RraA